jgi:hypothetical protein
MYLAPGITSRLPGTSRRDDKWAGTSKFSYSSEILEKHWEPEAEDGGNDWPKNRTAFRLRI